MLSEEDRKSQRESSKKKGWARKHIMFSVQPFCMLARFLRYSLLQNVECYKYFLR